MTTDGQPPDQDFARKSTDIGEDQRRWLAENAPADLRDDRLPSQSALGRGVSYDEVDPRFLGDAEAGLVEAEAEYRKDRRLRGSEEPPPPAQTLSRSEYLEQQNTAPATTEANSAIANPNRVWTGGYVPGPFDHDLEPDEELDAAIEESGEGAAEVEFESYYEDRDRGDLDDRPLWQRELDLTDDDLEDDLVEIPHVEPPPPVPLCVHCKKRPIKYKKKGWCARCHEFQRTHKGQLPPLRLTVGRRQR